jgi:hypothetical protein
MIYFAEYESRKYAFRLIGESERQAKALMIRALRKHARDFDWDLNWFYPCSITVIPMPINVAFRDYSEV